MPRFVYGPRSVAMVLPVVLRPAFRRRAPATAQVLADWETIVGPALAEQTVPQKLFGGTLTIACSGPVAMELQHLQGPVMERINAHLGRVAVTRLRFRQDVRPAEKSVPSALSQPERPADVAVAQQAVAGMKAGRLRDALERLGRRVLAARRE